MQYIARTFLSAFLFLTLPYFAHANVTITEIMYDPEGADSKHEWVEIKNDGAPTDLSEWKLFEGGSNHGLTVFSGTGTVPTGGYAVFADDPATFLADYPGFSGVLFDVALSSGLNNTNGETLTLRDAAHADIDTVTYSPALGAAGDGNSLQKVANTWQALLPTPGATAGTQSASTNTGSQTSSSTSSNSSNQTSSASQTATESNMEVRGGEDRTLAAGAAAVWKGVALGLKGEPIENARLVWSFGNGDVREGSPVLYAYPLPGKYVTTLDASSGKLSASDRIMVTVISANIAITKVTGTFIEITNRGGAELDLGLWHLFANGKTFTFPTHTVILANSSIAVPHSVSGLSSENPNGAALLYPNGTHAAGYENAPIIFSSYPAQESTATSKTLARATTEETTETAPGANGAASSEDALRTAPNAELTAAALSESAPDNSTWYWFLSLGAVIFLGVSGVYLVKKKTPGTEKV